MQNLTTRQKQIIDVTISLIAERGIQNLTTKNISEKIGISEAAIYRHFNSKLEILLTLLDNFEYRFNNIIEKIETDDSSNLKKLEKFYLSRCKEFAANPSISKVIFSEEIFQNEKLLADKVITIMQTHQKTIMYIVSKARENGEITSKIPSEHITRIIMGSLRLTVTKWRMSNFSFDLVDDGTKIWNSLKTLITMEV